MLEILEFFLYFVFKCYSQGLIKSLNMLDCLKSSSHVFMPEFCWRLVLCWIGLSGNLRGVFLRKQVLSRSSSTPKIIFSRVLILKMCVGFFVLVDFGSPQIIFSVGFRGRRANRHHQQDSKGRWRTFGFENHLRGRSVFGSKKSPASQTGFLRGGPLA